MAGKSEITAKPKRSKSSKNIHFCLHEDKFRELDKKTKDVHDIITGNGTPEKGIVFQMALLNRDQGDIIKTLGKLDENILELTKKYDESINIANMVNNAIKSYKREVDGFEKGKKIATENKDKKTLKTWQIIGIIIGSVVGLTSASIGIINVAEKTKERKQKIEKIDAWMNLWDFSPVTRGGKPILDTTKFNIGIKKVDAVKNRL